MTLILPKDKHAKYLKKIEMDLKLIVNELFIGNITKYIKFWKYCHSVIRWKGESIFNKMKIVSVELLQQYTYKHIIFQLHGKTINVLKIIVYFYYYDY